MKFFFFVFAALIILCSCGSQKSSFYRSEYSPAYGNFSGGNSQKAASEKRRMVIYNASLTMVVKNQDSVNLFLTRTAAKYEGYVLTLGSDRSVIRVKTAMLSDALKEIATT